MLALAEQLGFGLAYAIASGATAALITLFAAVALRLGRRCWALAVGLGVLYAVLYLILETADYALLAGSVLTFAAIAATMVGTRNEVWYPDANRPRGAGWFRRSPPAAPDAKPAQ